MERLKLLAAVAALLALMMGCSFMAPGWDTRQALETHDSIAYDLESLNARTDSTHDGTTVISEGGGSVTPGENGAPPTVTSAENGVVYFRQSSAETAGNVKTQLDAMNLQAWTTTIQSFTLMFDRVMSLMEVREAARAQAAAEPSGGAAADCPYAGLKPAELLDLLLRSAPPGTPAAEIVNPSTQPGG